MINNKYSKKIQEFLFVRNYLPMNVNHIWSILVAKLVYKHYFVLLILNAMAAPKATTIKDAIKRWEDKTGQQSATATEVSLVFQWPPIEKMDNTLSTLTNCE